MLLTKNNNLSNWRAPKNTTNTSRFLDFIINRFIFFIPLQNSGAGIFEQSGGGGC